MSKNLRWKFLTIIAVAAIAIWAFYPPFDAPGRPGKVKLGLDLKGGVHLVLKVRTDDALKLETEMATERLREALAQANVHGVTLATQPPTRVTAPPGPAVTVVRTPVVSARRRSIAVRVESRNACLAASSSRCHSCGMRGARVTAPSAPITSA